MLNRNAVASLASEKSTKQAQTALRLKDSIVPFSQVAAPMAQMDYKDIRVFTWCLKQGVSESARHFAAELLCAAAGGVAPTFDCLAIASLSRATMS
jgi:hypothetical protein